MTYSETLENILSCFSFEYLFFHKYSNYPREYSYFSKT